MVKLKLIKAHSYSGLVSATKAKPFVEVEAEKDADVLVATGYFERCAAEESEAEEAAPNYDALFKLTKAELTKYAEDNGISLVGCNNKADMLVAISAANSGNPTMIDSQK